MEKLTQQFSPEFQEKFMHLYKPERPLMWQEAEVLCNELVALGSKEHVNGIQHLVKLNNLLGFIMIPYRKMKDAELKAQGES